MLNFLLAFPGIALVSILIPALAVRWFTVARDRRRTELLLVVAALTEPFAIASQLIANSLTALRPMKLDLYIYQLDLAFGEPSFRLGAIAARHAWLHNLIGASYGLLPAAMLATFAAYLFLASEAEAFRVVKTFALLFLGASLIYLAVPVSGPAYAFASFPNLPVDVIAHPIALNAPPNGVPSCHTGAALLCLWFARRWRLGQILGLTFLGLTVLATLGSGQHYLFDLFCAVPYSASIVAVSQRSKRPAEVAAFTATRFAA